MKHIKLATLISVGLLSCGQAFAQKMETVKELENTNRRPFLVDDRFKPEDISTKESNQEKSVDEHRRNEIEKIRANEAKQVSALKKRLKKKIIRLRTQERADKVDMDKIYKSIDEIAAIRASIMKIKAENRQRIRNLQEARF